MHRENHNPAGNGRAKSPNGSPQSDADWIRAAVQRFEGPLTAYAAHVLGGDVERARDVVQEAFLRLIGQDRQKVSPHLTEWLYTVCRNLAIDARRRSSRMQTIELPPSLNGHASDDPAVRVEQRDSLSRALDLMTHLPANQQEALRLKFQHSLTYKEIAAVMGESEANVGWLIHSGLKTLRTQMQSSVARAARP